MNEKWTALVYNLSIMGIILIFIIVVFNKPRRWLVATLVKAFSGKKENSYFEKYRLRYKIKKAEERLSEIEGQIKPRTPMKDSTKNIIAACIIALGLIISTIIYAYSTRYQIEKFVRIDKWKGTYQKLELQAK